MSLLRVVLALLLLVAAAAQAAADTGRITVERALVWSRPSGVSVVLTQLSKGDVVEVLRKIGDWYEIVVPNRPSSVSATGFISVTQVALQGGTLSPATRQPRPPTQPGRRMPRRPARSGFFNVDGNFRNSTEEFQRMTPAFDDQYAEAGEFTTDYGTGGGWAVDALTGVSVQGSIGVGAGISYLRGEDVADVSARIPHPLYFNQPRSATFTTAPLKSREIALHIPVVFMPPARGHLKLLVYGGPSLFRISQTVVNALTLDEVYPFDMVRVSRVETAERTTIRWGYHAGVDIAYFFTPTVGVGGGIRYSRADVVFDDDQDVTTKATAGGVQAVAGLRVRF